MGWSATPTLISTTLTEIWVIRLTFILQTAPTMLRIAVTAECSVIPPTIALFFVGGGLNVAPPFPTLRVGKTAGIGLLAAALWPQPAGQIRAVVAADLAVGDGAGLLPHPTGLRKAVVRATQARGKAKAAVAAEKGRANERTYPAAALWPQSDRLATCQSGGALQVCVAFWRRPCGRSRNGTPFAGKTSPPPLRPPF